MAPFCRLPPKRLDRDMRRVVHKGQQRLLDKSVLPSLETTRGDQLVPAQAILLGAGTVWHPALGNREHRWDPIGVSKIEEHSFRHESGHLSGSKIHDEQSLLTLKLF